MHFSKAFKQHLFLFLTVLMIASIFAVLPASAEEGTDVQDTDIYFTRNPETQTEDTTTTSTTTGTATASLSTALPTYDLAVKSTKTFPFRCTAPAGATIKATVNGKTYALKQNSTAKQGTAVYYSANYTFPSVTGTKDLGPVTYTMTYNGKTSSITSEGHLFAVGTDSTLKIMVKNTDTTVFSSYKNGGSGNYVTVAKKGALDFVSNYYGDLYQLNSGGWIRASAVTPVVENYSVNNTITQVISSKEGNSDLYTLVGNSHPIYHATMTGDQLVISFYNTKGVDYIDVSNSTLFANASVSEANNVTTITFTTRTPGTLWGYTVEYSGGKTTLLCKPKPSLSNGELPLQGLTIALDAGHGGSDKGALGLGSVGSYEKDINLATANTVKAYLESKGATVVMLRADDSKVELNDRLAIAQAERVDFMISLHCNSTANNSSANGVETFYYHNFTSSFAKRLAENVATQTGRTNRGPIHSCYVVSLPSYAPAVLLEMGFISNQNDYNSLKSTESMNGTAVAIYDSIISELQ